MEVRVRDEPSCDFCGSTEPHWLFRARNYRQEDIVPDVSGLLPEMHNAGGWLACHACAPYVQRADWGGLARRVMANGGVNPTIRSAMQGLDHDVVASGIKKVWKQFAAHRVGGAIEWRSSGQP